MIVSILLLIAGMALLIKGADWFVSGSGGIARRLKIPPLVIGLTLVSIGTSAPEASVSVISAVNGLNDLSIGNVVGSNIFNALLILGVGSLIIPITASREMRRYDLPIMVGIYAVLMLFCFAVTPYSLDLFEGIILLALFAAYTAFLVVRSVLQGRREKQTWSEQDSVCDSNVKELSAVTSVILALLGLVGIVFGGKLVVDNASKLATELGMSESLVGLTIVAVGTSLPELVTSIVASVKKENDIAIGNVVGSNIFNIVFILGTSAVIRPLGFGIASTVDLAVMFASGVIVLLFSLFGAKIRRWQGALLVAMYAGYLAYIIVRN